MRIADMRLADELPDVEIPAAGYGQRELMLIETLYRADMPDGELINLYYLVHDWHSDDTNSFGDWLKRLEASLIDRLIE